MNNATSKYESELQVIGQYRLPGIYGGSEKTVPKFNRPITPRENLIRYLKGENPMWMPDMRRDCATICPYVMPDSYARAFGGVDWFGIDWTYEPNVKAAMVTPGTRRLSDISRWEEELVFPDLDAIDWEADVQRNYAQGLSADRFTTFVILNGLFERTADLTSFEDTFCYLLEDPETLTAFYDKLVQWTIQLMGIARKYYHADMILFHDDMGSQNNAFFSSQVFREIMMPQYQKITGAAHEMGMFIALHSCGNVKVQIPNFIESGFDCWEGQNSANNKEALMEQYGDRLFQMSHLIIEPEVSDEDAVRIVKETVDGIGKSRHFLPGLMVMGKRKINIEDVFYLYTREMYDMSHSSLCASDSN